MATTVISPEPKADTKAAVRETEGEPVSTEPPGTGPPQPAHARRYGERRIYPLAFAVSLVVHVLAIALYPLLSGPQSTPPTDGFTSPAPRFGGTEVIRIVEVEPTPLAPQPEDPVPVRPLPDPDPPAAGGADAPDIVDPEISDPALEGPRATVAERIRARNLDPRLWVVPPELTDLTPEELMRLRLMWAFEEVSDSALAAEIVAQAGRDWTYTDGEGRRWGISEGQIHLGDVTIPLPFAFSPAPNSAAARRAWEDAEIARGAVTGAARDNLKERIKAIRERIERERAEANEPPPADTSGLRR